MGLFIFIIIAVIIAIIVASRSSGGDYTDYGGGSTFEAPEKQAGRIGEKRATNLIKEFLLDGDRLFTNVQIEYDGKPTELDNIIVNKYGVFIIEVKTYKGYLYGGEDDYEWIKCKDDGYGNTFEKRVKNPIKQVKRQVYLLAKYSEYYGCRVWVNGYAFLLYGNSPVKSEYMISELSDIGKVIHTPGRNYLTPSQIDKICNLLADE